MRVHADGYENTVKYKTKTYTCTNCKDKETTEKAKFKCIHCGGSVTYVRHWDGKISYIDRQNKFLTGFLPLIISYIESHSVEYELVDNRNNKIEIPDDVVVDLQVWDVRKFMISDLHIYLKSELGGISFPRGIYKAATNAGKNSFMASIALTLRVNTLVIVHRDYLFKQAYEFFTSVGLEVSRYGSGKKELGSFTIAMVQTMSNRSNDINMINYLKSVKCLMVDECHRASAKSYKKIFANTDAYVRLFVSGTPLHEYSDTKNMDIIGQSGVILSEVTNKFLIDKGYSQKPTVLMYSYDHNPLDSDDYYQQLEKSKYSMEKIQIIRSIIESNPEKQVLIIVEFIEHGQFIYDQISDMECIVEFAHGDDEHKSDRFDRAKSQASNVLISSLIIETGVNIPTFNIGINMFGGKSRTRVKQCIGRLVRHDGINDDCIWVDFIDKHSKLSEHTSKRETIYEDEGFEIIYK